MKIDLMWTRNFTWFPNIKIIWWNPMCLGSMLNGRDCSINNEGTYTFKQFAKNKFYRGVPTKFRFGGIWLHIWNRVYWFYIEHNVSEKERLSMENYFLSKKESQ